MSDESINHYIHKPGLFQWIHVNNQANIKKQNDTEREKNNTCGLVVLNTPIINTDAFCKAWNLADPKFRILADGGANQFYNFHVCHSEDGSASGQRSTTPKNSCSWLDPNELPAAIVGDLDSVENEVRTFYEKLGVPIIQISDQNSTDLMKAIIFIGKGRVDNIIIYGSLRNRVDQAMGILASLKRLNNEFMTKFWLLTETNITFTVLPGLNEIDLSVNNHDKLDLMACKRDISGESKMIIERHAGIIPLYERAIISLKGFRYDVENWETCMEENLSLCNIVEGSRVNVKTNVEILVTLEL